MHSRPKLYHRQMLGLTAAYHEVLAAQGHQILTVKA
jgi:hypothetical protein